MSNTSPQTSSWKLFAAAITTVVLWASAFVGIRIGLTGYTAGALALFRFSIASISILILYFRIPRRKPIKLADLPKILITGIIGIGVYNIALNYGEITVPAGIASFIIGMMPVVTIIISAIFLKEPVYFRMWIGVAISLIGLAIIAFGEHSGVAFDYGVVTIFISAICGGFYSTIQRHSTKKFTPIEITAFAMWSGTLFLLIFTPQLIQQIPHAPLKATLAAIYMGIFPGALGYAAWSYVLTHMPASRAAPILYAIPIVTTLLSFLILGEFPAWLSLIGGLIALAGAIFVKLVRS